MYTLFYYFKKQTIYVIFDQNRHLNRNQNSTTKQTMVSVSLILRAKQWVQWVTNQLRVVKQSCCMWGFIKTILLMTRLAKLRRLAEWSWLSLTRSSKLLHAGASVPTASALRWVWRRQHVHAHCCKVCWTPWFTPREDWLSVKPHKSN